MSQAAPVPAARRPVDIAICLDENVLLPAVVLLRSIEEHAHAGCPVRIHALTTFEAGRLERLAGRPSATFELIVTQVDDRFSNLPRNNYISQATYLRFLLPDLLPEVKTLIYLDIDMALHRDLAPLAGVDVGDLAIGAVSDTAMQLGSTRWETFAISYAERSLTFAGYVREVVELPDEIPDAYFNAGLLVMNLAVWRRDDISRKALDFIATRPPLKYLDQDALNHVVQGRYLRLDSRWNAMANCLDKPDRRWRTILSSGGRAWERARAIWQHDPWVIHFAGQHKPWDTKRPIVHGDTWWDYAKRSNAWPLLIPAYERFEALSRAARDADRAAPPFLQKVLGLGGR